MNLFRFLLAVSVATVHFGNPYPIGGISGKAAVELFFVISGFFMESTLTAKYKKWRFFYLSRALRIYPMYLFVLAVTLFFTTSNPHPECNLTIFWKLAKVVSNFSLIGLDFLHFIPTVTTQNNKAVDVACSPASLIVVVVAWTLSLEIVFYLFAPIVNKLSTRKVFAIWVASLGIKFYLLFISKPDPWNYRFFPAELCFFLTGTLFARIKNLEFNMRNIKYLELLPQFIPAVSVGYFIFATRFFSYFTLQDWPVIFVGIVIIFLITQTSNIPDVSLLGELSYPLYLCHFLILSELQKLYLFQVYGTQVQYLILIGSALLFSFLLVHLFTPVNKIRKDIV